MAQTAHVQLSAEKGKGGDKLRLRSWIGIKLIGEDGSPIPNEAFAVKLPGGKIIEGQLDEKGVAVVKGIPSGTCLVSFPNLDKDAWTPVDTSGQTPPASEAAA